MWLHIMRINASRPLEFDSVVEQINQLDMLPKTLLQETIVDLENGTLAYLAYRVGNQRKV